MKKHVEPNANYRGGYVTVQECLQCETVTRAAELTAEPCSCCGNAPHQAYTAKWVVELGPWWKFWGRPKGRWALPPIPPSPLD